MLCMGVFYVPAFAGSGESVPIDADVSLFVQAAWIEGEMLRINVTDAQGINSSFAVRLADFNHAENTEYIMIQAVDMDGNASGVIQIRNPNYVPTVQEISASSPVYVTVNPLPSPEPAPTPPPVARPLTPDGTGTVIDNVMDSDGIEFFTIGTEDENVFYLIIDRQRSVDNVYLLNAVTEEDLMSLAQRAGREITLAAVTPDETEPADQEESPPAPPEATPEPSEERRANNNTGTLVLLGAVVAIVGVAGYYFKIVKGKKDNFSDDDDYGFDDSDDDNYNDELEGSDDE
jgi:hypothetical protein